MRRSPRRRGPPRSRLHRAGTPVRGGPVRHAVPGRRGRPGGRDREIEGPRRLAAHGTVADATRGPPEEGESAAKAGRGHVQGDAQSGADADAGRPPSLRREGAQGDEGHRRYRLSGLDLRPLRDRWRGEGLQIERRGARGRAQAHPRPQYADRTGGQERGGAEAGETHSHAQGRESGKARRARTESRGPEGGGEGGSETGEGPAERGEETLGQGREEARREERGKKGREEGG